MLEWLLQIDYFIFTKINSVWTQPWMDIFFPFITDLHKTAVFKYVFVPCVLMLFIYRRKIKNGLIIFIFSLLAVTLADGIGTRVFKHNFERNRPFQNLQLDAIQRSPAGGFSFVSNHASNNFAYATFVSTFFPPARIVLFAVAIAVSYSRVYNGVHYPSDVLCGALLGMLSGIFMSRICRKILKKANAKEEVPL